MNGLSVILGAAKDLELRIRRFFAVCAAQNDVAAALLFSFLLAASAFAHAGHQHVFGFVKQLHGDALLVHTTKGTDATVGLTKATVYKRGDAAATRADLVPGVRVVIDLTTDGKAAESVKIGTK
jgi:hypothetical protein